MQELLLIKSEFLDLISGRITAILTPSGAQKHMWRLRPSIHPLPFERERFGVARTGIRCK